MGLLDFFLSPQRQDVSNPVVAVPQQGVAAPIKKPAIDTPKYSAKETVTGRVTLKPSSGKTPYDPVAGVGDTRMANEYKYDEAKATSPDYKSAPSIEQAFGMKPYGGGWKGALIEGGKGFLMTAIPTIIGGLTGGRKGAGRAYEIALQNQLSGQEKRRAQTEDVMSNPKLRTAYELARADYENDYNLGTPKGDFGFYLGEKLLGMEDKWGSGQLGTLIKLMGPEGGLAKYEEMRQVRRGGGGGGAGGTATIRTQVLNPDGTMSVVTQKVPSTQAEQTRSSGRPFANVQSSPTGMTTRSIAPISAASFIGR